MNLNPNAFLVQGIANIWGHRVKIRETFALELGKAYAFGHCSAGIIPKRFPIPFIKIIQRSQETPR